MPRTYVCRGYGRTHSLEEYEQSRFCRSCGTYLMSQSMASEFPREPASQRKEGSKVKLQNRAGFLRVTMHACYKQLSVTEYTEKAKILFPEDVS